MQVWQAILVKKVDLDSRQAQAMMSEGARDLLKVCSHARSLSLLSNHQLGLSARIASRRRP